jgi:hypothetical protein
MERSIIQPQGPGRRRMHADPAGTCHDSSPRPLTTFPLTPASSFGRFLIACRGIKFQIRPGTFGNRASRRSEAPSRVLSADVSFTKLHSLNDVIARESWRSSKPPRSSNASLGLHSALLSRGMTQNEMNFRIAAALPLKPQAKRANPLNLPNRAGSTLCDRSSVQRRRRSTNTRPSRSRACSAHR